ncbi:C-terminal processing protease CtpA/Prc, contains a PDZ domain [Chryseobacterium piscicola]|uniref:C-terminal processing protease CtpA/Prc, contains a PDZ domain n=1 Tax=Chryseobacterium piscicola TaxID=551459 RepID=A0A1N7NL31_9FLAO|nr:S41 family peptidase [Chryseobacterium piscicola]PQA90453.1 hypothetical protein B0A70_14050 [Chryseobacterium piscicola]SIS99022.1 C-terminal processing protease CtpA/Prc, contains a PDZ domain [Chryseobacterium piscicola]
MKRFLLLLVLVFAGTQQNFAQEKLSETQKLEALAKVWGFLKYYHPNVSKGTFDWDQQLIDKINQSEKVENRIQFNTLISEWIDSLGKVDRCKKCSKKDDRKYFLKNFDLSWTDDRVVFDQKVIEKLNFIEQNRNQTSDFYYTAKRDSDGYFGVQNEKMITEKFPEKQVRLLELFRYWNTVEYFFPYKYQTDQKWNDVLKEMIAKFTEVKDRKEYLLTMAELAAKTNDNHVHFMAVRRHIYYGDYQIPAATKYVEKQLIVTDLYFTKTPYTSGLQKFDIIKKIDGKTPEEIQKFYSKYVPASNEWTFLGKITDNYLYSFKDKINLEIIRNNQPIKLVVDALEFKNIDYPKSEEKEKWKLLDNNTGYVNIGALKVEDVKKMFEKLGNTEALIFDMRNYPNKTTGEIAKYLLPSKSDYYIWMSHDITYPGKFYEKTASVGQNNSDFYKGKVIALVNDVTQSQAETLTMMLKQHPNTKVIGSNTAGANGNIVRLNINNIHTAYSGLGAFYPDGRETQRIGILPDIIVKPTVNGIQNDKDEVLERALQYIKTGK